MVIFSATTESAFGSVTSISIRVLVLYLVIMNIVVILWKKKVVMGVENSVVGCCGVGLVMLRRNVMKEWGSAISFELRQSSFKWT
jgi:hypothetical protein